MSDQQFQEERKALKKDGNIYTGTGNFYESGQITNADGGVVATYVQFSIDDQQHRQLAAIASAVDPIPMATLQFFGLSVITGAAGGGVLYALTPYLAPTVTTLGVSGSTAGVAQGGALTGLSIQQLDAMIHGTQQKLLAQLFKGQTTVVEGARQALANLKIPPGLTRQALLVYQEIARRYIEAGRDATGVQAVRLEIIKEALKKLQ